MDLSRQFFAPFASQGFQDYAEPAFNDNSRSMYVGRASYPGNYLRPRQPQEETLDLSQFDDAAQKSVDSVPLHNLTKPPEAVPWSGAQPNVAQHRRTYQPTWPSNSPYTKSEPPLKQDCYSEFPDSAYGTSSQSNWNPAHYPGYGLANESNDGRSVVSDGRLLRKKQPLTPCTICSREPKNPSDAKKHYLTHQRPFRCHERDCNRKGEGFATDNDLQRHRKTVHNLMPSVGSRIGYICASCPPPDGAKRKFWPRRDNFKAHIKRKHKGDDVDRILDLSWQNMRPDDAVTVKTTQESIAYQSQIDPTDLQHYQIDMNSDLPRHSSEHGNYHHNALWPAGSAAEMTTESLIGGMHGHLQYQQPTMPASGDDTGLSFVSDVANAAHCTEDGTSISPFKRQKTAEEQYYPEYPHRSQTQIHIASAELQPDSASSGSISAQSAQSAMAFQGEFECSVCHKKKRRDCDLKKHMKRHTRPYGCTFPSCQKKFGSRNDWKRHESSQHFLQEMWKCGQVCIDGKACMRRPFQRQDSLEKHLRGPDHNLQSPQQISQACKDFRLGREGHDRFWCGFCGKLVEQQKGVQTAWDERSRHIGDHFDKNGCDSGDWVCIEENKKKKYIVPNDTKQSGGKRRARAGGEEEGLDEYTPEFSSMSISTHEMVAPQSYGDEAGALYMLSPSSHYKRKHEDDVDAAHEVL